jgi:peroxiredoxin
MRMAIASLCMIASTKAFIAPLSIGGVRSFASSAVKMAISEGSKLPMGATFNRLENNKPTPVPAADVFAGKKVVVCGVPGALTPTCSETHLPGFVSLVNEFKSKGVDSVVCISVNDAFVMNAWKNKLDIKDEVDLLADGNADFAKAIGCEMDTGAFGGVRLRRLAMLVDDGVVQKIGVEEGGGSTELSDAKTILAALE